MSNFSPNDETSSTIFEKIKDELSTKLNKGPIYVYANNYSLWLTNSENQNSRAKLLLKIEEGSDRNELLKNLFRYLSFLFQKEFTTGESITFFFKKEYRLPGNTFNGFLRLKSSGILCETGDEDIRKLLGNTYIFQESFKKYNLGENQEIIIPRLISKSQIDSKKQEASDLLLSSESLYWINKLLTRPLEENEYLYIRPIIRTETTSRGESYNIIYLLPIESSRKKSQEKEESMHKKK